MKFRYLLRATVLAAASVLFSGPTSAQLYAEVEPNNPCDSAQVIGTPAEWPAVITGYLTPTGAEPPGDVDFFVLQATEGSWGTLRAAASLGKCDSKMLR